MEMSDILVSIIIPVYNAGKYILDTLECIKSQTLSAWELLLVDNGSTDDSVTVIKGFIDENRTIAEKIKLLSTGENTGAAGARNLGTENASGRYIAFLDADDLWAPDKLEKQIAFMKENDCAFSFTAYEFADDQGIGVQKIVHVPLKITYRKALGNTTIFTSTVMFDMDKLEKELVMMPHVPSEDTATWWKVLKNGYSAYGLDEALTLYRRSGGTLSSNKVEAVYRIWNLYRNVEHLNVVQSSYYFVLWAVRAVERRI